MSKKLNIQIKSIDHLQGHNKRQGFAHYPTEKNQWNSTGILVEFQWNKRHFFHWKRVIPLEFPLDSSGNSTGSVEILLYSVEIPLDSSGIPLDSSGIPLDSGGNSIGIPLDSSGNSIAFQ